MTDVAREMFIEKHGRAPANQRELDAAVKVFSRPAHATVAGFDITFSPVKSVSSLWAIAPRDIAMVIEKAHEKAIGDALALLEREVLFTREGKQGARQVATRGLIAAAFTHRDSRAGDPDLHTHVAISNKVQTAGGKWLSIYGRVLYESVVAVSETYNTALERHLVADLGLRFEERPDTGRGRPVREVAGVEPALNAAWSKRRKAITDRQGELSATFQREHGRPPTQAEAIALAQQANLETRTAKHEPRSLAEQRETWRSEAVTVLGSERAVKAMAEGALTSQVDPGPPVDRAWFDAAAGRVVGELESRRSTWKPTHVRAEAERQVRAADCLIEHHRGAVDDLVAAVLEQHCVALTPDLDPARDPRMLLRPDGTRVYRHTGHDLFTSPAILAAEQRINDAAGRSGGRAVPREVVDAAVVEAAANGTELNPGQAALVSQMATSGARVQVAIAAAGAGKTTAMRVLARAWSDGRGDVIALDRGASVRLIGDDRQLSAVGAGGVLRDISHQHDAIHLDEVMRFSDPAEAAATLHLRDGNTAALGFYFDTDRIHIADAISSADQALAGWSADRTAGLDSIMIAPTHGLVSTLNDRARAARLVGADPGVEVALQDGSSASVGDVILTRRNDRRLAVSGSDWVKNGDRWVITGIDSGAVRARHCTSGLHVNLPAAYVAEHVDLGYATTVHTAQGVTADTMHGIATGEETRQLLYTMMSRGRHANHLHLAIAPDGDPHQVLRADTLDVATATEVLEAMTSRDDTAISATETARVATSHEAQLHQAVVRYADAILTGSEELAGPTRPLELARAAESRVPGITDDTAWPSLLAELQIREADGHDGTDLLTMMTRPWILASADSPASAIGSVLHDIYPTRDGPLPWLPRIPTNLTGDPTWGPYLRERAGQVHTHTDAVRETASDVAPKWVPAGAEIEPRTITDVAIWRAAHGITDHPHPTGPAAIDFVERSHQRLLDQRVMNEVGRQANAWITPIVDIVGREDQHTLALAEDLAHLTAAGRNGRALLAEAAAQGDLPDEHATAALHSRIIRLAAQAPGVRRTPSPRRRDLPRQSPALDRSPPRGPTI